MASAASLTPQARRRTLVDLLVLRGFAPDRAAAEVARMADATVAEDLDFHLREDGAYKRGALLPTAELIAHYTGPIHHMDLQATEAVIRVGGGQSPAPRREEGGPVLTTRAAVLGVAGLGCLFTLTYLLVRASRSPRTVTTGEP